jgi:hypothetical protein
MAFSTESQEPGNAEEMAPIEAAEKVQNFDKSGSGSGEGLPMSYPLTEEELSILDRQTHVPDVEVGLKTIVNFATRSDLIIIIISGIFAMVAGGIIPLMSVNLRASRQNWLMLMYLDHIRIPCPKFPKLRGALLCTESCFRQPAGN